jgi:signal transduction histidine kinase
MNMFAAQILIVEDNTTVAKDLRQSLEGLGYGVSAVVATGQESIEEAESKRPDAVLMDIKLRGGMDGISAAEEIQSRFEIPVLFLSAYSDRELLRRAKRVGAFGYLIKPFEERELYTMLETTLYKANAERERRRMEARLRQSQKLEAIRRMAGGVAHHFNNMLQSAIGYLDLAIDDLPPEEPVQENLRESQKAAYRAARMSGLMLSLLGQQPGAFTCFDLPEFCESIRGDLEKKLPEETVLEMDFPAAGPAVRASRDQLKKVLEILVENAGEAIAESETPAVTVSMGTRKAREIPVHHRFPGDWEPADPVYAAITVRDGGRGMDPETIETIFDPFFTDKRAGRGLGLSVALGIVHVHEGCLVAESRPGGGTVIDVFLPLAEEEGEAEPAD